MEVIDRQKGRRLTATRVAVIDNVDRERLDTLIRELLTDTFRVPNAR